MGRPFGVGGGLCRRWRRLGCVTYSLLMIFVGVSDTVCRIRCSVVWFGCVLVTMYMSLALCLGCEV